MVCACSTLARTGSVETFCSCAEMNASFEERLAAIERKLEKSK